MLEQKGADFQIFPDISGRVAKQSNIPRPEKKIISLSSTRDSLNSIKTLLLVGRAVENVLLSRHQGI